MWANLCSIASRGSHKRWRTLAGRGLCAGGWADCVGVILLHASAVITTSVSRVGHSMQHSLPGIA